MKGLVHSDNAGAVGHTSIWAQMSVEDMEWLLEMEPEGHFINTFYPGEGHAKGFWTWSWRTNTGMIENIRSAGGEWGFYFTFPRSSSKLLVALTLMGMKRTVA